MPLTPVNGGRTQLPVLKMKGCETWLDECDAVADASHGGFTGASHVGVMPEVEGMCQDSRYVKNESVNFSCVSTLCEKRKNDLSMCVHTV